MKKRVLIISTSAGTGHVRAGEALTKVFEEHPMVGEVVHSDALDFTNKVFGIFTPSSMRASSRPRQNFSAGGINKAMNPGKRTACV